MQNTSNKKHNHIAVPLMSSPIGNCQSWLNSSESQVPHSSLSNVISLNGDSPRQIFCKEKQSSRQQDQDSSSTQSTGQSHLEVPSMEGANPHKHSGYDGTYGKPVKDGVKSMLSQGAPDFAIPASQVDYSQTLTRVQYAYADPYFGGMLAPCGPQAMVHPTMVNVAFARVPLPLDPAEDEPIYVNPKQYRGILRRRESRAKLEAQNKLIKARKPYLHESRHLHALKRVRGSGGRFLNTKKSDQSDELDSTFDHKHPEMPFLKLGGNQLVSENDHHPENSNTGASTASCSDTSTISGGYNMLQLSDLRFPNYPTHMNGAMRGEGGLMCNGSQYRVPVIR